MGRTIKIAIVEDIAKIAQALKEKVELAPEFQVDTLVPNGHALIKALEENHGIDVVLMDINMPVMNGVEAASIVSKRWPQIKVVMCTVFEDEQNIFDSIMAGASGYLLKDEPPAKVHKSIYEALEGGAPMSSLIAKKALNLIRKGMQVKPEATEDYGLTSRETEVLEQLAKGLSYDQVSSNLFISYGTTRKHVENIYKKLRVHNKVDAIQKGRDGGII